MRNLITFFALLFVVNASAQYPFPDKELCDQLKNRTLAVQLIKEKSEVEKNLNKCLIEEFTANWKLTPVKFVTEAEINKILEEKNTKYAVLTQNDSECKDERKGYIDSNGVRHNSTPMSNQTSGTTVPYKYVAFSFSYYAFQLKLPTEKKAKVVTTIGLANGDLTKIDYIFVVQQLNRLINASLNSTPMAEFYNVDRNIATIQSSNLCILADFIKDKEKAKVAKVYPNKYELVDFNRYQDIVINKPAGDLYVKIIWSVQHNLYIWVTVNPQNGDILSLMAFGGVKVGSSFDANEIIKADHLKYVSNKTAQKFNNKYK